MNPIAIVPRWREVDEDAANMDSRNMMGDLEVSECESKSQRLPMSGVADPEHGAQTRTR